MSSMPTRRQFLISAGAATLAAWGFNRRSWAQLEPDEMTGLAISQKYPETTGTISIKDPSRFTVMQFTDVHLNQERKEVPNAYERTISEWKQLVDRYKPDMIAVTGDLWHENYNGRGDQFMQDAVKHVSGLGLPWSFSWGNHDKLTDIAMGHDFLHDAKGSLYRGGPNNGNYTIDVLGPDGKPVWELICMNTSRNGLVGPSHDWLAQLSKERAGAKRPNAFGLFHIPLKQYSDVMKLDPTSGIQLEPVSSGDEDGSALGLLKSLGNVRACFCGHDHKSDYSGNLDGIELVYGRSSGWAAYGWVEVRKGAKLITTNCETGNYAWETVFPDGLRWHPNPGQKIQDVLDQPWMKDPVAKAA